MKNKIFSIISLSQKAGKIVSGEFQCEKEVKAGKVFLLIIAEDASFNTIKKFKNMCSYRNISMITFGNKQTLGNSIGKEMRATIGILDLGLAKMIIQNYGANK